MQSQATEDTTVDTQITTDLEMTSGDTGRRLLGGTDQSHPSDHEVPMGETDEGGKPIKICSRRMRNQNALPGLQALTLRDSVPPAMDWAAEKEDEVIGRAFHADRKSRQKENKKADKAARKDAKRAAKAAQEAEDPAPSRGLPTRTKPVAVETLIKNSKIRPPQGKFTITVPPAGVPPEPTLKKRKASVGKAAAVKMTGQKSKVTFERPEADTPRQAEPPEPMEETPAKEISKKATRKLEKLAKRAKKAAKGGKPDTTPPSDDEAEKNKEIERSLDSSQLMDGLTVWVNHPTLAFPPKLLVAQAVQEAVIEHHQSQSSVTFMQSLEVDSVLSANAKSTVLRVISEHTRKLFTDHRISARLVVDKMSHPLHIQSYREGGNTFFFLSGSGQSSMGHVLVEALQRVYPGNDFALDRCCLGSIKSDDFFVSFVSPLSKLARKIWLDETKKEHGPYARMEAVNVKMPCRNTACRGVTHNGLCLNVIKIKSKSAGTEGEL